MADDVNPVPGPPDTPVGPAEPPAASPPAGARLAPDQVQDWVARLRAGDQAAWDEVCRRWGGVLRAHAVRLNHSARGRPDVSSVVQDALLNAWRHRRSLKAATEPGLVAWLMATVVNAAYDRFRYWGAECRDRSRVQGLPESPSGAGDLAADQTGPLSAVARAEAVERLWAHVNGLDPIDRAIVILRYNEGLLFSEIADPLGMTEEAVRKRCHRAREELAEGLGGGDDGP